MSLSALQQSLWTRLYAEMGVEVTGIYADVPQSATSEDTTDFPFITLGPYVASAYDTKGETGDTVVAQVHIWMRTHDNLRRAALHDGVKAALHRYSLPITGADYSDCLFEGSEDFADPDGKTRHIVMRFRVTSI